MADRLQARGDGRLERRIIQLKIEQQAVMKEEDDASRKRLDLLKDELIDLEEREYAGWRRCGRPRRQAVAGTQHIKEELEQARQARRGRAAQGTTKAGMSELQYGRIARAGAAGLALQEEMQETSLLRNQVTDGEIAEVVWRAGPAFRSQACWRAREKLLRMEDRCIAGWSVRRRR